MIHISKNRIQRQQKTAKQIWLENRCQIVSYNLSEQTCIFQINKQFSTNQRFIIIEMYIKPLIGLFAYVQFKPKIYYQIYSCVIRPKIYNDQRIFHPNISMETCQIYFSQIINWNPTFQVDYLLRKLKYTIIEPNVNCVPNNLLNRKAAMTYLISRNNYQQSIIKYSPINLNEIICSNSIITENMFQNQDSNDQVLNMSKVVPKSRCMKNLDTIDKIQQDTIFLIKKIKKISLENDKYQEMIEQ